MKKIFLAALLITGFIVSMPVNYAADETSDEIKLYLGQPKVIPVSHPSRVVVGNPNIADILNVSKTSITLNPKASGATSLVYWDNYGEQSFQLKVYSENMQQLQMRIDDLLKQIGLSEVYTRIAEEENKVLLLGKVKTSQDKESINIALGPLKDKTIDLINLKEEETVIEIDVQVLELDKDATTNLGLTNPLSTADGYSITEIGSPGLAGTSWGKLFRILDMKRDVAFNWKLYALTQEGKARILSRPRLACQSGKEAELLVGGEKPIMTTTVAATTGAQGTQVEYKEFGIKLRIKPTVTEEDRIKLGVNVEVSEVGTAETLGSAASPIARAYPLSKRSAATELFINNGQTMSIGGLMKNKFEEDVSRTPGFSNIPVFGMFFRKKTTQIGGGTGQRGDTELYILLTPTIVSRPKEAGVPKDKIETKPAATALYSEPAASVLAPSPLNDYAKVVQKRILDNLAYPATAKASGFVGTVKLSLQLSYSGELLGVQVKSSSGYKSLDDNAVYAARTITHYPPFPPSIDNKELWIDIPIDYRLN